MNVSSAIIVISESKYDAAIAAIKLVDGCEVQLIEKQKIIVTIEADGIKEETGAMRELEEISGVISAKMVYTYSEDELDAERHKIEIADDMPEWLNDENVNAKNIPYSGNLKM